MFWDNLIKLCNANGISPNGVCAELGLSNAISTKRKNGAVPRHTTIKKIADYFGVTPDSLLKESSDIVLNKQTDIALSSLIAELINSDDECTKRFVIKFLRLPPQSREVFITMLSDIAES